MNPARAKNEADGCTCTARPTGGQQRQAGPFQLPGLGHRLAGRLQLGRVSKRS